jgi:hypothetical protein
MKTKGVAISERLVLNFSQIWVTPFKLSAIWSVFLNQICHLTTLKQKRINSLSLFLPYITPNIYPSSFHSSMYCIYAVTDIISKIDFPRSLMGYYIYPSLFLYKKIYCSSLHFILYFMFIFLYHWSSKCSYNMGENVKKRCIIVW